jgi:hypothetical protein
MPRLDPLESARRPSSSHALLAVYGALLAHQTDHDAKRAGSMIPGIGAVHIATAVRRYGQWR